MSGKEIIMLDKIRRTISPSDKTKMNGKIIAITNKERNHMGKKVMRVIFSVSIFRKNQLKITTLNLNQFCPRKDQTFYTQFRNHMGRSYL
jgi:hypothetical protein